MKFYEELSSCIVCLKFAKERGTKNLKVWQDKLDKLKAFLPSGSGFDRGTELDLAASNEYRLVFRTHFHHMDDHGFYTYWTDHGVSVRCSFDGVTVTCGGPDRNGIREYIQETFQSLSQLESNKEAT